MDEKVLKVLEYDKILDKLANLTNSVLSQQKVLELCPSTDINEIIHMQKETGEALNIIMKKGNVPISGLKDIRTALKRADIGAILNPKELLEIAHVLKISRNLKQYIKNNLKEQNYNILEQYIEPLKSFSEIESEITTCIITEEEISDKASPELANIRRQMKNTDNKIKDLLNNIINSQRHQKYLQEGIVTVREGRYVVPVKAEHKANVQGVVHDSSASGATVFIEPMAVVQANNQIRELEIKERNEIERILAQLTILIQEQGIYIKTNLDIIINIDFIFAKARLALKWNAIAPKMNNNKYINIKKGRHPLLDPKTVVATDFYIGKEFDTLIITGPNTGGKTVALKTVGLFVLMAQSGLHIPANHGTELAVFDNVFADIGDEQSIEQSLSTFSSHMKNIVRILKKTDSNSLTLFDELGAGTDPVEGAALAMSILEHLRNIGATTVATTHYSELKLFALSTPGIENACCEFNVETLEPTFKLLIGIPGKSNAFAISQRLGLNNNIIDRAGEFISAEDIKFEDVISNIEQNRQIAEKQKDEALLYKHQIKELKDNLTKEKEKLDLQKDELLYSAKSEAKRIIQQAKQETEYLIEEIRKIEHEKEEQEKSKIIMQVRTDIRNKINKLDNSIAKAAFPKKRYSEPPKNLKIGEEVLINTLNKKGSILTLPDNNGDVQIQVGIMKINAHISNLRLVEVSKQNNIITNSGAGKISMSKSANISSELDLRGQVLEEALFNTDKFLDDASLAGLEQITIIHGKGTGALRTGLHNMFKSHTHVKSFRLGKYGEGESGVTIIELK